MKIKKIITIVLIIFSLIFFAVYLRFLIKENKVLKRSLILKEQKCQSEINSSTTLERVKCDNDYNKPFYLNQNMSCRDWSDSIPLWKTYTNNEFKFKLTLPGKGIFEDAIKGFESVEECSIQEINSQKRLYRNYEDEMELVYNTKYSLSILPWNRFAKEKTLREYLIRDDTFYNYKSKLVEIEGLGADEAYDMQKSSFYLYPTNTYAMYKKGEYVFILGSLQNGLMNHSCIPISDYWDKDELKSNIKKELEIYNNWDKVKSIIFFN